MNWRRGLVRLWLIISVIWVLGVGSLGVSPGRDLVTHWAAGPPHLVTDEEMGIAPPYLPSLAQIRQNFSEYKDIEDEQLKQRLDKARAAATPPDARTDFNYFRSTRARDQFDAPYEGVMAQLRAADATGNIEQARRMVILAANLRGQDEAFRKRESAKDLLVETAGWAVLPPLTVFILGAAMMWVARGFRAGKAS